MSGVLNSHRYQHKFKGMKVKHLLQLIMVTVAFTWIAYQVHSSRESGEGSSAQLKLGSDDFLHMGTSRKVVLGQKSAGMLGSSILGQDGLIGRKELRPEVEAVEEESAEKQMEVEVDEGDGEEDRASFDEWENRMKIKEHLESEAQRRLEKEIRHEEKLGDEKPDDVRTTKGQGGDDPAKIFSRFVGVRVNQSNAEEENVALAEDMSNDNIVSAENDGDSEFWQEKKEGAHYSEELEKLLQVTDDDLQAFGADGSFIMQTGSTEGRDEIEVQPVAVERLDGEDLKSFELNNMLDEKSAGEAVRMELKVQDEEKRVGEVTEKSVTGILITTKAEDEEAKDEKLVQTGEDRAGEDLNKLKKSVYTGEGESASDKIVAGEVQPKLAAALHVASVDDEEETHNSSKKGGIPLLTTRIPKLMSAASNVTSITETERASSELFAKVEKISDVINLDLSTGADDKIAISDFINSAQDNGGSKPTNVGSN